MAREPSLPDDQAVGSGAAEDATKGDTKPTASNRTRKFVTGAAIGIGAAALVAALLYANRSRKGGEEDK